MFKNIDGIEFYCRNCENSWSAGDGQTCPKCKATLQDDKGKTIIVHNPYITCGCGALVYLTDNNHNVCSGCNSVYDDNGILRINKKHAKSQIYIKMNSDLLAKCVINNSFDTVFVFGETDSSSDYPDTLEHDKIGYWYGCYLTVGKLDNPLFIIDCYGGGASRSYSLACCGDLDNPLPSEEDEEYITEGLKRYFKDYGVSAFVYVGTTEE